MVRVTVELLAVDVDLRLAPGTDPRAPGGAVTVALCGHWDHEGPCRWPHHSRIDDDSDPARLCTVAVVPTDEWDDVTARIETELRRDDRWTVLAFTARDIGPEEHTLAEHLSRVR
jgi:hypothetical protein